MDQQVTSQAVLSYEQVNSIIEAQRRKITQAGGVQIYMEKPKSLVRLLRKCGVMNRK